MKHSVKRIVALSMAIIMSSANINIKKVYSTDGSTGNMSYEKFRQEFFKGNSPRSNDYSLNSVMEFNSTNEFNDDGSIQIHQAPFYADLIELDPNAPTLIEDEVEVEVVYGYDSGSGEVNSRDFNVQVTKSSYDTTNLVGNLVATGEHCNIWVIDSSSDSYTPVAPTFTVLNSEGNNATSDGTITGTDANAMEIAKNVDVIYKKINADIPHANVLISANYINLKELGDINNDGKVNLILYDIYSDGSEDAESSYSFTGGYFNSGDMNTDTGIIAIDAVHMDIGYRGGADLTTKKVKDSFYGTFAHELQHMLYYMYTGYYNGIAYNGLTYADLWFNESLSGVPDIYYSDYTTDATNVQNLSYSRINSGVVNAYNYDYLNFADLKNYGMGYMFSAFMTERDPDYLKKVYAYFSTYLESGTGDYTYSGANTTTNYSGKDMQTIVGGAFKNVLGDGFSALTEKEAFEYIYRAFMESYMSAGGNVIVDGEILATTSNIWEAEYGSLWSFRNGNKYYESGSESFYSGNSAYEGIANNGSLTLTGGTTISDGATHEKAYTLDKTGYDISSANILSITVPEVSGLYAYVAVYDTSTANLGSTSYNPNNDVADLYPLELGKVNTIEITSETAVPHLFATTFYSDINTTISYEWVSEVVVEDEDDVEEDEEDNNIIIVTSVSLDKANSSISIDGEETLIATVLPENATDKTVTWTSSDDTVATVTSEGLIKGIKSGETIITVATTDGNFKATCNVTVNENVVEVTGITVSPSTLELEVTEKEILSATVSPENATDKTVTWTSSDDTVATVSSTGEVTGVSVGEAIITGTIGSFTGECLVEVKEPFVPVTEIEMKNTDFVDTEVELTLTGEVSPSNATNQEIVWSVSDANGTGATITKSSDDYIFKAVAKGEATITATILNGATSTTLYKEEFTITVNEPFIEVTQVNMTNEKTVNVDTNLTISGTVDPDNATNKDITWSISDDGGTNAVIENNIFRASDSGTATITATVIDGLNSGNYTETFQIVVEKPFIAVTSIEMTSSLAVQTGEWVGVDLTGAVKPSNADNSEIVWSIKNDNTDSTNGSAVLDNDKLTAIGEGEVIITGTVANGKSNGSDYTEDFTIVFTDDAPEVVKVDDVTLDNGETVEINNKLILDATVEPSNATNKAIVWSVKKANSTGAIIDGTEFTATTAGYATITATIKDGISSGNDYTKDFEITVTSPFVEVTNITLENKVVEANSTLTLNGTVLPTSATEQDIVWAIKNANGTGATISGDDFTATSQGTATITATIRNGKSTGADFTEDFTITVTAEPTNIESVTNIDLDTSITIAGTDLNLVGEVVPANATYTDILWTVEDQGTTGGTISGNILSTTNGGVAKIRGTIVNGQDLGVDYYKDFNIIVTDALSTDLNDATVTNVNSSYNYTGSNIEPTPVVTMNGVTLTENTDYEVSYESNLEIGTGKVVVTGKGNYTGTKTVNFSIVSGETSGDSNGNSDGTTTTPPTTTTPTATYTITFDPSTGTSSTTSLDTNEDGNLSTLPTATKSGYTFLGWYLEDGTKVTINTEFTANTTVTAKYQIISSSSSGSSSSGSSSSNNDDDSSSSNSSSSSSSSSTTTTTNTETTETNTTVATVTTTTETPAVVINEVSTEIKVDETTGDIVKTTSYSNGAEVVQNITSEGKISAEITGIEENTKMTIPLDTTPTVTEVVVIIHEDGTREIIKDTIIDGNGLSILIDSNVKIEIVDNSKTFEDVIENYIHMEAVDFVTSRELFNGMGDGNFEPEGTMTRAMIWTVLHNYQGENVGETSSAWYGEAQEWAIQFGISDGSNPDGEMSREQLAVLLYRIAGEPSVENNLDENGFGNSENVSQWAESPMSWAVKENIILGGDDGNLYPQANATRGEVATILMRYMSK